MKSCETMSATGGAEPEPARLAASRAADRVQAGPPPRAGQRDTAERGAS